MCVYVCAYMYVCIILLYIGLGLGINECLGREVCVCV